MSFVERLASVIIRCKEISNSPHSHYTGNHIYRTDQLGVKEYAMHISVNWPKLSPGVRKWIIWYFVVVLLNHLYFTYRTSSVTLSQFRSNELPENRVTKYIDSDWESSLLW